MAHLAGFTGVLQLDGYEGCRALTKDCAVRLAVCWAHVCWAHVRRGFIDLADLDSNEGGTRRPVASIAASVKASTMNVGAARQLEHRHGSVAIQHGELMVDPGERPLSRHG